MDLVAYAYGLTDFAGEHPLFTLGVIIVGDHEIPQVGGVGDHVIPHPAIT